MLSTCSFWPMECINAETIDSSKVYELTGKGWDGGIIPTDIGESHMEPEVFHKSVY